MLHGHALELAKETVVEDMEEIKRMREKGDDCGIARSKENIIRQLKRINGKGCAGIKAVKNDKGEVRTDTKGIVDALQDHWAKVFKQKGIDDEVLARWLQEVYPEQQRQSGLKRGHDGSHGWSHGLPPKTSERWKVRRKDIAKAIKISKNSAPGPDGLPYKVWRELGDTGVDILWGAFQELGMDEAIHTLDEAYDGQHGFNASIMACLPKAPVGISDDGEDVYDAASTRPLSIVNTDNRLMCSAARLRWENIFSNCISSNQKRVSAGPIYVE